MRANMFNPKVTTHRNLSNNTVTVEVTDADNSTVTFFFQDGSLGLDHFISDLTRASVWLTGEERERNRREHKTPDWLAEHQADYLANTVS